MRPGARLAAALEILTELDRTPAPADAVYAAYVKARRFIGAKDRAAIAELIYGNFRRRRRLDWHIAEAGLEPTARLRLIADQMLTAGGSLAAMRALFSGTGHDPARLSDAETMLVRRLEGRPLNAAEMSCAVRLECPDWAEAPLRASLGDRFGLELRALIDPAAVDLRANLLKADRDRVRAELAADGILCTPTPLSPWGLRVEGRPPLSASRAFREGLFEIQDEGSQLVAFALDARPGMQVVDFCAGAGGKTLAAAATMGNRGRIVACDVSAERLDRAARRLRRAGAHNVERRVLSSERDPWIRRHKERFDRVLVDAPCSGTGTWRRNPDARWGRGGPDLDQLVALQDRILASAARLVRPGGRLVYATCSLLRQENEDRIAAFLAAEPRFAPDAIAAIPGRIDSGSLRLSPARNGTDGFFIAGLQRLPGGEPAPTPLEPPTDSPR